MAQDTVTLVFAGDSKSLDATTKNVVKDLDSVADKSEHVGRSTAELGEKLENSSTKFRGGADAIDGAAASLEAFGVSIPGPIGNVLTLGRGLADLSDGIATTVLPLLGKLKVAALATLGPWGLIAVAVIALGAAFVIAYKKSETFRDIVHKVVDGVKAALSGLVDAAKFYANALVWPYKTAFNLIADAWNNTVGKLSFKVPGWVPGLGGKGWDVPDIPHFATGGVSPGGLAVVGERGQELITTSPGQRVLGTSEANGRQASGQQVTLAVQGPSDDLFVQWIRRYVRVVGGGDVQVAFGR